MFKLESFGRTVAALALTFVFGATALIGAVGPAVNAGTLPATQQVA